MTATELRQHLAPLPDDASVPVGWVRSYFEPDPEPAETRERIADLRVPEVAEELGRAPSTVRGYIRRGELDAYRFGREYRIRPSAVRAFLDKQAEEPVSVDVESADLGSWRRE